VPSQSVEAASRDEAIAAAREQFGPTARIVGVRRIRSGGMFGFFTNERFIAEVELPKADPVTGPDSGSLLRTGAREARSAGSLDDRMQELAELLGSASQEPQAVGLYGRAGVAPARP
jgi:flagellar biosynthesis GTPase FlhF